MKAPGTLEKLVRSTLSGYGPGPGPGPGSGSGSGSDSDSASRTEKQGGVLEILRWWTAPGSCSLACLYVWMVQLRARQSEEKRVAQYVHVLVIRRQLCSTCAGPNLHLLPMDISGGGQRQSRRPAPGRARHDLRVSRQPLDDC